MNEPNKGEGGKGEGGPGRGLGVTAALVLFGIAATFAFYTMSRSEKESAPPSATQPVSFTANSTSASTSPSTAPTTEEECHAQCKAAFGLACRTRCQDAFQDIALMNSCRDRCFNSADKCSTRCRENPDTCRAMCLDEWSASTNACGADTQCKARVTSSLDACDRSCERTGP